MPCRLGGVWGVGRLFGSLGSLVFIDCSIKVHCFLELACGSGAGVIGTKAAATAAAKNRKRKSKSSSDIINTGSNAGATHEPATQTKSKCRGNEAAKLL